MANLTAEASRALQSHPRNHLPLTVPRVIRGVCEKIGVFLIPDTSNHHKRFARIKRGATVLCVVSWVLLFLVFVVSELLGGAQLLNNTDLRPIGPEEGSIKDYLTNVWFWDGLLFLTFVVAILCSCLAAVLSIRGRYTQLSTNGGTGKRNRDR
jgi:hypothetical protein